MSVCHIGSGATVRFCNRLEVMRANHSDYFLNHGFGRTILANIGVHFEIPFWRLDSSFCGKIFKFNQNFFAQVKRNHNLSDDAVAERVELAEFGAAPEIEAAVADEMNHPRRKEISVSVGQSFRISAYHYLIFPLRVGFHIANNLLGYLPKSELHS